MSPTSTRSRSRREHHSLELRSILQLRWQALTPVLATPTAKSSWLPVTRQNLQGRHKTSTLKTSPQTSYPLKHLRMRPTPTGTLDVSITESATSGAGVFETASPSATSQKLSRPLRAGYTPPRSNASCRSQRSHAKLRGYVLEKSSPSSQKTLHVGRQQGHPAAPHQEPRQRS
jgi:hypothetical protein